MPKTRKFETEIENHRAKLVYMTIKVTDLAQICSRITQQSPKITDYYRKAYQNFRKNCQIKCHIKSRFEKSLLYTGA